MRLFPDRPKRGVIALLLALAALEIWLRFPVLLGGLALYQRDLFLLYFPLVQSVLRVLSEGAWPLRDPSSAFGQPLLADPSCQILYPPVLIHLFMPPHRAYAWFVSIHSVFGALGVGLLARRFSGGSWLSALVGGVAWLTSGPLQSLATLWHHQAGAAWIPWVLLCVDRLVSKRSISAALTLGGVAGAQILAGSADMCAMTILLSVLFVAPVYGARLLGLCLLGAAIAVALSAGIWLPASELVLNSARSALPESSRTYWSLHPLSALEFFLPIPLTAMPFLPEWRVALFEGREPFLGSMFLGSLSLPLVLSALADGTVSKRLRFAGFFGISAGFLIALGKNASAYAFVIALIPPLKILRFPSKAMIPVAILMCVFAGIGAAAICRSARARMAALGGVLFGAVLTLAFLGPSNAAFSSAFLDLAQARAIGDFWANLSPHLWFSVVLLATLVVCLRWSSNSRGALLAGLLLVGHLAQSHYRHQGFNATVPTEVLAYRPESLPLLRPPGDSRTFVYDYSLIQGRATRYLGHEDATGGVGLTGLSPDAANMIASDAYLTPLTGAFWGIDYAWDADLRLLFDRRLANLTIDLRRVEGTPAFVKLLQISGVSRVAARHEAGMEGLKLLARRKIYYPDDLRIYEVPTPLPRALLTSGRTQGTQSDLRDLMEGGFDPGTTVLVDSGPTRKPFPGFDGRARILSRTADRLTLETSSNAPAFLTVIEGAMPGWRVWVDDEAATVERANALFIGTEVPAGLHRVEFRFLPLSAIIGVSLSGLTALALILGSILHRAHNASPVVA